MFTPTASRSTTSWLTVCAARPIRYAQLIDEVYAHADEYDLIVLDEAVSVYGYAMVDRERLCEFLRRERGRRELVLTGRDPLPELYELCDYVTEMRKCRHPFDEGISARRGIEY